MPMTRNEMNMQLDCLQRIKNCYENSRGDSTELFREILRISNEYACLRPHTPYCEEVI